VLTHTSGGSEVRTVREAMKRFPSDSAQGNGDWGNPIDRDTTKGVLIVCAVSPQGAS